MCELDRWLEKVTEADLREELTSIVGKAREIEDRFYCPLSFGTGGLRGVIGAGTNRMNVYTVGRATLGLGEYLLQIGANNGVVIAYDSRNKSREFAHLAASVLSSMGLRSYLFAELTPTPVLSFAVRHLGADAGIVITASHNPKEYNGYKVYNARGSQITDEAAKKITACIEQYDYFTPYTPNEALITVLDDSVERAFLDAIKQFSLTKITAKNAPSIVYSPLHGTGRKYVQRILAEIGVQTIYTVQEQEEPDGNFTTCPYPNPEEKAALSLALRDAERYHPDLVLATDPDADRVGIAVPNQSGEYVLLNGNETGSILFYYVLLKRRENGIPCTGATAIKTIVTSDIIFDMARAFGAEVREVLTGFKYIGEALDQTADYLLGLEESYGYLVGTHARDKDAVSAVMMIAEACAYFKEHGKPLYEVLEEIYQTFGYYKTDLLSFTMKGKDGMAQMQRLMSELRRAPLCELCGQAAKFDDFSKGLYGLPQSDVLRSQSEDLRIIVRPSGTEPKIKIYLQARAKTSDAAWDLILQMRQLIAEKMA